MSEAKVPDYRQAKNVALGGLLIQVISVGTLATLSYSFQSDSLSALAIFLGVSVPIWFVLLLVFRQLRRVSNEQLETAELRRAQAAGGRETIFDVEDENLLIEQNRLRWMLKWILPAVTVLLALVLFAAHFLGFDWTFQNAFSPEGVQRTTDPMLNMWFVVAIGLGSFLYARYTITLARIRHWRLLRAGAVCSAGNAIACLLLAIALMAGMSFPWAESLFAYLIRILLIVLAIEFSANFILDFYRPHAPGVLPRPSFESRLLGLFAEPGGIAKSIADAINYQFGFEVSSTWFYQLLQRWLFPITVFTFFVVLLLSSVVIVDANEAAVIERFGRVVQEPAPILEPGLHFKWPYPVDVVRRAPVGRIRELVIGEATQVEEDEEHAHKAVLWTETHDYVPELMLLVNASRDMDAAPRLHRAQDGVGVPVALLMVSVPIEYRIKDIRKYLYNYADPEKLMEAVAYEFLTEYGAGVDLDSLMGAAREELNRRLQATLQERLDAFDTGIEIVFAGTRGAHPPAKSGVAEAYLGVITSETQKHATIKAAEGEAQRILTAVAGTQTRAEALDEAIIARDRLRADPQSDPQQLKAAEAMVADLLLGNPEKGIPPLSGAAAAVIAEARAAASNLIADAATKVRAFKTDLVAFNSAPELFRQRKQLEIWNGLEGIRKYLIVGDPSNVIIEYETEQRGGLDQVLAPDKN